MITGYINKIDLILIAVCREGKNCRLKDMSCIYMGPVPLMRTKMPPVRRDSFIPI